MNLTTTALQAKYATNSSTLSMDKFWLPIKATEIKQFFCMYYNRVKIIQVQQLVKNIQGKGLAIHSTYGGQ